MKITSYPEQENVQQPNRLPLISVVVPMYNEATTLPRCLTALAASTYPNWELIVVDDGSSDGSARLAAQHSSAPRGALLLPGGVREGPATARNRGAEVARGEILLFVDADVVVRADTVARVAEIFRQEPALVACFGSYDDQPVASNFLSQYKNLLHHHVHQQGKVEASTFWAGCGAIRCHVFRAVGGFDRSYIQPSIEDIELGERLRRQGQRIRLEKRLQVTHLKRWTAISLLRSDIFDRALPWSRLLRQQGNVPNALNLRRGQRLSALLAWLGLFALAVALFFPGALFAGAGCALGLLGINYRFYRFLGKHRGLAFTIRALPWHWLYFLYSSLVFSLVILTDKAAIHGIRTKLDFQRRAGGF